MTAKKKTGPLPERESPLPGPVDPSEPLPPDPSEPGVTMRCSKFRWTDMGFGERFVARFGAIMRYCYLQKLWFGWDSTRWRPDDTGVALFRAGETARAIHREVDHVPDEKRKAVLKHAVKSEDRARVVAGLFLASVNREIQVRPDDLDCNPWLLNVPNGTIDLKTCTLRPHDRADLITKCAPVAYDPDAECPRYDAVLEEILPDADVRAYLQRLMGSALVGEQIEHILAILYGPGANGKSVFVSTASAVLGEYAATAAPDLLTARRGEHHPTELADLEGRRLVFATETAEGSKLAELLVKRITGADRIKARRMRQDFYEFEPSHTLIVQTNHLPRVTGTDHAMWRRLQVVEFPVTIPPDRQDPYLTAKLKREGAGILRWMVEGCMQWQKIGLSPPAAVTKRTEQYAAETDPVRAFLVARCDFGPGYAATTAELYEGYCEWAEVGGFSIESRTAFGARLRTMNYGLEPRKVRGTRGWRGLRLKAPRVVNTGETASEGGES